MIGDSNTQTTDACGSRVEAGVLHRWLAVLSLSVIFSTVLAAQEEHRHNAPEKLGNVSFAISCGAAVQGEFDRGVALLHSFAYAAAERAFRVVAERNPACAMAHWGVAMTYFHQLWDPPLEPGTIAMARGEIDRAAQIGGGSERERQFIGALGFVYQDAGNVPYPTRLHRYEQAMSQLAADNHKDVEAQVFYALALLASASPTDKAHVNQKQAVEILEPLWRADPQHPGIPHYLIHACDNAELASTGLAAARTYARIAPSAPHALHMPSHIFTRLGLWDDSIASNLAARAAARRQGDVGEELHAMDYLVYAYLQSGRDDDAARVVHEVRERAHPEGGDFKVAYALTAIPVRYAIERSRWAYAAGIISPTDAPAQVVAIAIWARGLGLARSDRVEEAQKDVEQLRRIARELRGAGNEYWAAQVEISGREVEAWSAQADGEHEQAVGLLREAADEEDALEKLPVTPGPIVPAREQLGELLLEQNKPSAAAREFELALINTPGRRGALRGAEQAAKLSAQP